MIKISPEFLSNDAVIEIHDNQIKIYKGNPGIFNYGLLESAVAQPQAGFDGKFFHSFPFEMAACYAFHVSQNHSFNNANKRTGAAAAILFLKINGYRPLDPNNKLYDLMIDVANGLKNKKDISEFLELICS
jgi:death-on-curing protein